MMNFELIIGENGQHYFHLVEKTGNILLHSQGYRQKDNVLKGIELLRQSMSAPSSVERKMTGMDKHWFIVKSPNGKVVGTSEMFPTPEIRDRWLRDIQQEVTQLGVVDSTH